MTRKTADANHPLHELIAERWSPLAFADRSVPSADLASVLEAARWAPSSYNEQPWSFALATRENPADFETLADLLVEGNAWARRAPVLLLSIALETYSRNAKPNIHAWHDVGLAAGTLVLQAQALGLAAHQMGGFDAAKARAVLELPDNASPVAMIALGYPGTLDDLPESMHQRESSPRTRKPLAEIIFSGRWGEPATP